MTYSASLEASLVLYQEGRFKDAYDLITTEASSSDAIPALVYYLRYSFAARAGMVDLAMDLFKDAVLDKGYWFSNDHLEDDDLEPLRSRPEFQYLAALCRERQDSARKTAVSEMELVLPRSSPINERTPMVVAIHGNQLDMHMTKIDWCGRSLSDCLLVFPQSSYAICTGAYSWPDPMAGVQEVRHHLDLIYQKLIASAEQEVILGGFSAGGRVALHAVLKGTVQAKGIILVGPWLPDMVALEPMLTNLVRNRVKVYLICGDQDRDCFDSSNKLAEIMSRECVQFRYRMVRGMGHQYPDDFDEELGKACSFILDE